MTVVQLWLPFNELEKKPAEDLPHFENPKNDNERLLEFQYRYKTTGDKGELGNIYSLSKQIAYKFINKISCMNPAVKMLSAEAREEKAVNCAEYMIEQHLTRPDFAVTKNYPGYVYLRVLWELYGNQKKEKRVKYWDLEKVNKKITNMQIREYQQRGMVREEEQMQENHCPAQRVIAIPAKNLEFKNVAEAAKVLNVDEQSIRNAICTGKPLRGFCFDFLDE